MTFTVDVSWCEVASGCFQISDDCGFGCCIIGEASESGPRRQARSNGNDPSAFPHGFYCGPDIGDDARGVNRPLPLRTLSRA